jgi:hypothetical protein
MGNKPSSSPPPVPQPIVKSAVPSTQSAASASRVINEIPPPIPVCDSECQRQKKLDGLKAALDEKTATRNTDPEGYQKARLAYYTELNGPGWLAEERKRIAKDEIEPVLSAYQTRYQNLKDETKNKSMFINLINAITSQVTSGEQELKYISDKTKETADKAATIDRLNELNAPQQVEPKKSVLPVVLDVVLAILGIFIAYQIYSKFFSSSGSTVMTAGKRVLNKLIR